MPARSPSAIPWVQLYTPINEMFICAVFSAKYGWWNEQKKDDRSFVTALKHIVKANVMAMIEILKRRHDAIFIQSESSEYYHADSPAAIGRAEVLNQMRFLSPRPQLRPPASTAACTNILLDNGMTREEYHWFLEHRLKQHCILGNDYYMLNEHRVFADGHTVAAGEVFGYCEITRQYYNRYRVPVMHTETNLWEGPARRRSGQMAVEGMGQRAAPAQRRHPDRRLHLVQPDRPDRLGHRASRAERQRQPARPVRPRPQHPQRRQGLQAVDRRLARRASGVERVPGRADQEARASTTSTTPPAATSTTAQPGWPGDMTMKIGRIETFYVPPRWLFVRVESDDGAVGWGEASLEGHAEAVDGAFEALRDRFIGHDPRRIEDIWQVAYRGGFYRGGPVLMSALAGLEQALWDLKGKALGLPAWEMLGGQVRDKIRAYAWIGGDRPHEIADAAKARARRRASRRSR